MLLLSLLVSCATPASKVSWPDQGVVLTGASLVDARGRFEGHMVVLSGAHIHAVLRESTPIPSHLDVVDLQGAVLAPGLIDTHVHMAHSGAPRWVGDTLADNLRAQLAWGVLGAVDLGGPLWTTQLRDHIEQGALLGPRLKVTGPFLTTERSHPCEGDYDRELCVFVGPDAGADGERVLDQGVDRLKLALQDADFSPWPSPRMDLADLAALCEVDPWAVVHVGEDLDAADAFAAGCRSLAHVPFGDPLSDEVLSLPFEGVHSTVSASAGVGRVLDAESLDAFPTVSAPVLESWQEVRDDPSQLLFGWVDQSRGWTAQTEENLEALVSAGAAVLPGSDAGYLFIPHGQALHEELLSLERAGMSADEVFAAATLHAADWAGWGDMGLLAPGFQARLLVLDADPLVAVENLQALRGVFIGERYLPREEMMQLELGSGAGAGDFCMNDGDCDEGVCDRVDHACVSGCDAPYVDLQSCGPDSWCAPAQALPGDDGVCHDEHACDWRAQDCGPQEYPQTCVPRDVDTSACWPAGARAAGETCDWVEPGLRCAPGLYCSPASQVCLQLCDPAADDCELGRCEAVTDGGGEPWFGLCL